MPHTGTLTVPDDTAAAATVDTLRPQDKAALDLLAAGATWHDIAAAGLPFPGASDINAMQQAAVLRRDPAAAAYSPAGVANIRPPRPTLRRFLGTGVDPDHATWDGLAPRDAALLP